jgi:membrane associated rhomboid family serine protease
MTDPAEGIGELDDGPRDPPEGRRGYRTVVAIFVFCLIPELILAGADLGLWGTKRWRLTALQYFGFWAGLLGNWRPNYALQPLAMFATYGFLHAGLAHFAVNMLTLFSLGPPLAARLGGTRFLVLYVVSIIGGAVGFALLSRVIAPMVGASGALFGLAGALIAWDLSSRLRSRASLTPVWRALLLLVALNLVLWWAMDGILAWETHLGGFLAGWASALLLDRRRPGTT